MYTKKQLKTGLLIAVILLNMNITSAQIIVPPSNLDQTLIQFGSIVACDMIESPNAAFVSAIGWGDGGSGNAYLRVDYDGNTGGPIVVSLNNFIHDIVIGDDPNGTAGEDYLVGCISGDNAPGLMELYSVTGVGTMGFAMSYINTYNFTNLDKILHGDMFADLNTTIGTFPAMYDFALTSYGGDLYIGPLSNPSTANNYAIPSGFGSGRDIACITDANTGNQIVGICNQGAKYIEFDLSTSSFSSAITYGSTIDFNHIAAMSIYDGSGTKYMFASSTEAYNDVTYTPGNPLNLTNTGLFGSTAGYGHPSIAAGVGNSGSSSNIGNSQYTISSYIDGNSTGYYARFIDWSTGAIISAGDYYQINNNGVLSNITGYISTVSCNNSGNGLLTAWNNGSGVSFKYSTNSSPLFKTTPVQSINLSGKKYEVYPNPATDKIGIVNMKNYEYRVSDITGKIVLHGIYTSQIDISSLTSGLYLVSFTTEDGHQQLKFAKQ